MTFFGDLVNLAGRDAFKAHLQPLRRTELVVYAKRPFGGPEAVLAYRTSNTDAKGPWLRSGLKHGRQRLGEMPESCRIGPY